MAFHFDPTDEERADWKAWVESRPEVVRLVAERFAPWELYRMKSTGHRVVITAFSEDGTVRVAVLAMFNLVTMERSVFGIDPNDLEPCELPAPDEPLGEIVPKDQQEAFMEGQRAYLGLQKASEN